MSSSSSLLIFGAGGHGKVVIDILEKQDRYSIAHVIDHYSKEKTHMGYPVSPALFSELPLARGIVALGDNATRAQVVNKILEARPDFEFVTALHPSAQIGRDVVLGGGTVVMAGVCVNPGTQIGRHVILNTRCSIDHDNTLEDFSSIGPGVTTGGQVRIGRGSAVAIGATCLHGIHVGTETVIGAGAIVTRSIPDQVVAYGIPCRIIRPRKPGDRYL